MSDSELESMVAAAKSFASIAHKGQKRNDGKDYITHPACVASKFHKSAHCLRAIAWLHDVVEDCNVTIKEIYAEFGDYIGDAVKALTHLKGEGETYLAYLLRVKENKAAVLVKRADLEHNCGDDKSGAMRDKYLMAQYILGEAA
jgi:(p)ppGpp synthase/HD superfamily hydrolase